MIIFLDICATLSPNRLGHIHLCRVFSFRFIKLNAWVIIQLPLCKAKQSSEIFSSRWYSSCFVSANLYSLAITTVVSLANLNTFLVLGKRTDTKGGMFPQWAQPHLKAELLTRQSWRNVESATPLHLLVIKILETPRSSHERKIERAAGVGITIESPSTHPPRQLNLSLTVMQIVVAVAQAVVEE